MNHLNEDTLIQVAFDLMEPEAKAAAQGHLDDCSECREALDALKRKFTVMESLTADEVPSDELIARTVAYSKQKPEAQAQGCDTPCDTKPNIPLYRRWWVEWSAAAAAVALICILLLQGLPQTQVKEPGPKWAKHPVAEKSEIRNPKSETNPNDQNINDKNSRVATALPLPRGSTPQGGVGFSDTVNGVRIVAADEIPDTPPFAPASAIELVVLPKPDKTQVTIYNSADLTLVRDTRKLTLKPGWNWLQFMWDNTLIDPTSLSLTPLEHADKVDIQLISYPARLKDIGRWLIRSEVEGAVPFEITYFASGLSWRAFYMGTMNEDETTMDLKGCVNVSNHSGQDFVNTQTRLIVGETRLKEDIRTLAQRQYPYGPEIPKPPDVLRSDLGTVGLKDEKIQRQLDTFGVPGSLGGAFYDADVDYCYSIKEIEKTGLSEYFLYTIEGTEDLTNQWTKRLPSFDVKDIPVKSLYKYDEDRYGKQALRFVSFKNDAEHQLGDTPIPEGNIKIYRNVNEQQNLSYIGGSSIKYIPVNEDIELNLGPARLVKVEPILMERKSENHTFNKDGNIDGWDDIETYTVTITNTRDIPIDIEITQNCGTDAWELNYVDPASTGEDAFTYKKHDKNSARFTMTVPAKTEKTFGYTIRKYQQKRIEVYVEKMLEIEK